MTAIIGLDVWTGTVVGPSPGVATHTQVNDLGVGLANRTVWLKNRVVGAYKLLQSTSVSNESIFTEALLSSSSSWTAVPGVSVNLSTAPVENDLLLISAHVQLRTISAVAVGTDYAGVGLITPVTWIFPNNTMRYLSDVTGGIHPVELSMSQRVGPASVGTTVAMFATSAGVSKASVLSPWALRVIHMRPVAAP